MNALIARYQALPDRDQRALQLLALFLLPLLLYLLLLKPSFNYYAAAKENFSDKQQLLDWMKASAALVPTNTQTTQRNLDIPLLQLASQTAAESGLKLDRVQPRGDNRVRIWLNEVAFQQLIQWYSTLQQSGITIASVSIDKATRPGIVSVQCLLTNGENG